MIGSPSLEGSLHLSTDDIFFPLTKYQSYRLIHQGCYRTNAKFFFLILCLESRIDWHSINLIWFWVKVYYRMFKLSSNIWLWIWAVWKDNEKIGLFNKIALHATRPKPLTNIHHKNSFTKNFYLNIVSKTINKLLLRKRPFM